MILYCSETANSFNIKEQLRKLRSRVVFDGYNILITSLRFVTDDDVIQFKASNDGM